MEQHERKIAISGVSEAQAARMLSSEVGLPTGTAEDVERAIPKFISWDYRSFKADFAVVNGDIIIQFYLPAWIPSLVGDLKKADPRVQAAWSAYWLEAFPAQLSPQAKEYFHADVPRLVAKYTEEVASWWFRAQGFGSVMNPQGLVAGFLLKFDQACQPFLPQ